MKIAGAEFSAFSLPLRRPLVTAIGKLSSREGFVLTLISDSGVRGVGEASPAYWLGGEQLLETRTALESILASIREHPDPAELRCFIFDQASEGQHDRISPSAMCALDSALLDLEARAAGVAVASILGAASLEPIPVSVLLSGTTPDELLEETRTAVAQGYRTLKLKVGAGAIQNDLERLRAVRAGAGNAAGIRLDANRAWTAENAVRALEACAPLEIEFIEEPLAAPSPEAMAELRERTGVVLALDESVSSETDLESFVAKKAADILVLKVARLGGPTRCLKLASIAAAAGMRTVVTDSIETAAGMGAAVHIAAALPSSRSAVGLGGTRMLAFSQDTPCDFEDAPWVRPAGPGLMVEAARLRT